MENIKSYEPKTFDSERWMQEIESLVQNASTKEDKHSLLCFQEAMKPLLSNPSILKNLLGKIAMSYGK